MRFGVNVGSNFMLNFERIFTLPYFFKTGSVDYEAYV